MPVNSWKTLLQARNQGGSKKKAMWETFVSVEGTVRCLIVCVRLTTDCLYPCSTRLPKLRMFDFHSGFSCGP